MSARLQRICVWLCDRAVGGRWSPGLSLQGLRPTLRWAWSGARCDLAPDGWRPL